MFIQLFGKAYNVQFDARNRELVYAELVETGQALDLDELDALNDAVESQADDIFAEELVECAFNKFTGYL